MHHLVGHFFTPVCEGCYYATEPYSKNSSDNAYSTFSHFLSPSHEHLLMYACKNQCEASRCTFARSVCRCKNKYANTFVLTVYHKSTALLSACKLLLNILKPWHTLRGGWLAIRSLVATGRKVWPSLSNINWWQTYDYHQMTLTCPKEEQSMKQNGSLCSVIAGNLAEVSLATQTWFLTEDKERWCCYNAAATTLTSNSNGLDFVFSSFLPSESDYSNAEQPIHLTWM